MRLQSVTRSSLFFVFFFSFLLSPTVADDRLNNLQPVLAHHDDLTTLEQQQQQQEDFSLEHGLIKLEETSQTLTELLHGSNNDNDIDSPLKQLLSKAIGYIQQIQQIAKTKTTETTPPIQPTVSKKRQQRRRQLIAASSQHHSSKVRHHLELHDALEGAGVAGSDEDGSNIALIQRYLTNSRVTTGQQGRRKLEQQDEDEEDDDDDDDDDDEEEGAEFECEALIKCLRDWTLLDVINFFYVNDEGEIIDDKDAHELFSKAKRIVKKLSVFPQDDDDDDFDDTIDFGPKCNSLLSIFEGKTWKSICQATPSNNLSLKDIEDAFGEQAAYRIFEDFVLCSKEEDLQEIFLDDQVQIPTKNNNSNNDTHSTGMKQEWDYKEFKIYNILVQEIGEDNITDHTSEECQHQLDELYRDIFLNDDDNNDVSPYLVHGSNSMDRSLPDLNLNCNITFVDGVQMEDSTCFISVEDHQDDELVNCSIQVAPEAKLCMNDLEEEKPTDGILQCKEEIEIKSLFQQIDVSDLQQAVQLVLGKDVSTGLICQYKGEAPGFCCLDQPGDDFTLGLWGDKFNCDLGESECQNVAPLLSGFSEQTCSQLYDGTYCLKRTNDCSKLLECIQEEMEWAEENDRMTYHDYLEAGPQQQVAKQDKGNDQCGMLREYHGFANNEEDTHVCSGIRQLRSHHAFEYLDKLAKGEQSQPDTTTTRFSLGGLKFNLPPAREKDEEQIAANMLGDLDVFEKELMEPEEPEHSEEYFYQKKRGLYQFKQVLSTLEETLNVLEVYTCPADPTFESHNDCAATKNIMSAILVTSLYISKRIYQTIDYFYFENDSLSDFSMDEMYKNIMKVHDNLGVLSSYAEVIRDNQQVLRDNQEVLSNQIHEIGGGEALEKSGTGETSMDTGKIEEKIDGVSSLVADVRVHLKTDMVNLNSATKLHIDQKADVVLQKIEDTCAPAGRRRLGLECSGDGLDLQCGFNQQGSKVSEDQKTLFVEEGVRKIDTGLFYEIKGACSDSADVSISVLSNEVDERQSAFLTKVIPQGSTREIPRVYVAPRTCKEVEMEDPCPATDSICEPSPSGTRFYDIQITVTDGASGDKVQDTCRVIVVPKRGQEVELRNGNVDGLTEQEQRKLVESSPLRTVVGTLSLQSQST